MNLIWKRFDESKFYQLMANSYCLYVFYHPDDKDHPYYIGKAKFFGSNQYSGYKGSARYNDGYAHLIYGMLRKGYLIYIARLGEESFSDAECYEQALIKRWEPIRNQNKKPHLIKPVTSRKPWILFKD